MKGRTSMIAVGSSLGILLAIFLSQTFLTINHSPSLVYKVFLCFKGLTPKLGDFVSIEGHSTSYFEGVHFTKRLVGCSGDVCQIFKNHMFVGGNLVGQLRTTTRDGKPIKPLKETRIPKEYVFVSAKHSRSFDSRYEEFGLVKESCITGTCLGLWPSAGLQ